MKILSESIWNLLAKLLAWPPIANAIIGYAKRQEQHKPISIDGVVYMRRYWIFNPWTGEDSVKHPWIPFSIRVHNFRQPDLQRHLHNHPMNARTIILRGGYREEYAPGKFRWCYPGSTHYINGKDYFHQIDRLSRDEDHGVWTIFIHGRRANRDWGFRLPDGTFIHQKVYFYLWEDAGLINKDTQSVSEIPKDRYYAAIRFFTE